MTLDVLKSALVARGGVNLGDLLFWTLSGGTVTRAALEDNWRDHGLDAAHLPELVHGPSWRGRRIRSS